MPTQQTRKRTRMPSDPFETQSAMVTLPRGWRGLWGHPRRQFVDPVQLCLYGVTRLAQRLLVKSKNFLCLQTDIGENHPTR